MKVQLFANKGRGYAMGVSSPIDALVDGLRHKLNLDGAGSGFVEQRVAGFALSMESIDQTQMQEVDGAVEGLSTALESIIQQHQAAFTVLGDDGKPQQVASVNASQRAAGIVAAMAGSDVRKFLSLPVQHQVASMEGMTFIQAKGGADYLEGRIPAFEAYDEKENKNAVVYSVAYNMQAARQDDFGETWFPTVVVTPDQVGITVSIRLVEVYNEVRRATSGAVNNFGKRNIIHAVIDPSILKNDLTKIIPVVSGGSVGNFVDSARVAPYNVTLDGETISTAPLKIAKKFSLLGVSQTQALLDTGILDSSDAIDPAVTLGSLYMTVTSSDGNTIETFKFATNRLPTSVFNYAVQGGYRKMVLNFETKDLKLGSAIPKMANGTNSTLLAGVENYTVRLAVTVFGSVDLETATTELNSGSVTVDRIMDSNGNILDLGSGAGATLKALFDKTAIIGYDLEAQRTNSNRRQRGQLLTTNFYNQVYAVPLRSPITCPRPLGSSDANDSSDLAALITATHVRTSNAAVDELLKADAMLADMVSNTDQLGNTPEILGVARMLVKPFYKKETLNVGTSVDSLTSSQRAADIQSVIVNKLRDLAYRMYRDSGYKAAADALAGGQSATPTLIIGTDPVIARYLMVDGDFRTIGPDFQIKVVSTLNQNMKDKIFMSFGDFTSGKDGVPNPMHFGNMAWKPELTLNLPIPRNGAISKELTVTPSFLHITNLPILARVDVSGIENAIASKVTVNMNDVG